MKKLKESKKKKWTKMRRKRLKKGLEIMKKSARQISKGEDL